MRYPTLLFAILVLRSWILEPLFAWLYPNWPEIGAHTFYAIYDLMPSLLALVAFKVVSHKQTVTWKRVSIDIFLAFVWADVFDRAIGITELKTGDWLLIVFVGLAIAKHTILKKYIK
jgi:hypothetical protein